jgi:hypothetical protein
LKVLFGDYGSSQAQYHHVERSAGAGDRQKGGMTSVTLKPTGQAAPPAAQDMPLPAQLADFAVVNAALYRQHYEDLLSRRAGLGLGRSSRPIPLAPAWHWPAFLITVPWMFYRKMYSGGIILVALPVLLDHILPGSLFLGSGLLIALTAGICGKSWYVEHAVRRIAKARQAHSSDAARAAYLARARGVSLSAGIFGVLILIVTMTVIVMGLTPPNRF